VKAPVPPPSFVFVLSDMVGPGVVLQHTPFAVTAEPPSVVIVPPHVAVVDVIALTVLVVTVDTVGVEKVISDP